MKKWVVSINPYFLQYLQDKMEYIADKSAKVGQNRMNKRKRKTVQREEDILGIIREYDHHEEERGTADLVVHYAFRLGSVGKPKIVEMDDASEDGNNEE